MTLSPQARPFLVRGVRLRLDHLTGKALLLRPEQGFELQGSAAEVVALCTATFTIAAIVERLSETHRDVTPAQIAEDVDRLLGDLSRRGLVAFEEP